MHRSAHSSRLFAEPGPNWAYKFRDPLVDSIFATLWAPEIRLWFLLGGAISFVAGFFAMSEGSAFRRASGLLFLSILFLAGLGILVLLWARSSFLVALIAFILYWICLRVGGRLMMSIIGKRHH